MNGTCDATSLPQGIFRLEMMASTCLCHCTGAYKRYVGMVLPHEDVAPASVLKNKSNKSDDFLRAHPDKGTVGFKLQAIPDYQKDGSLAGDAPV